MNKIFKELIKNFPDFDIRQNIDMQNKHTYHIKCFAKIYIKITSYKDLCEMLQYLYQKNIPYIILGGGSNVIFKEKIIKKVVVHLASGNIEKKDECSIRVFAGVSFSKLLLFCAENNLSGLEWSAGIPASVGGAVTMNMGAFGYNIATYVTKVIYFYNGQVNKKNTNIHDFSYRDSIFKKQNCVILCVEFNLEKGERDEIEQKIKNNINKKRNLQPVDKCSCGSVFKNPIGLSVAKLIDECGLKGYCKKDAEISVVHSNFIINKKNATFQDIFSVIRYVKKVVQKRYNICIFCEVVIQ